MKCNYCESEWNVSLGRSASISKCPFCGMTLLQEKKKFDTIEDVLVEMNNQFGSSVLTDETKLIAYFCDLAPHLAKQRRLLSAFVECNGHTKIAGLICDSLHEQSVCIQQIVKEMTEDMFVAESAAETICNAFFFAVSGHRLGNAKHVVGTANTDNCNPVIMDAVKQDDNITTQQDQASSVVNATLQENHPSAQEPSHSASNPMDLITALNNLKDIVHPDYSVLRLIAKYEEILSSEGKYEQVEYKYGPYYLDLTYYVQNETVYATIDYTGFAGSFVKPGVVSCAGKSCPITIEAVGVNKHTGGEHQFVFQISGRVVNVTGSGGFGKKTCRKIRNSSNRGFFSRWMPGN